MVNIPESSYLLYSAAEQMGVGPSQILSYMLTPLLFVHCQPGLNQICQLHGGLWKNLSFLLTI